MVGGGPHHSTSGAVPGVASTGPSNAMKSVHG